MFNIVFRLLTRQLIVIRMKMMHKMFLALKAILTIGNWGDYFLDYLGLKRGYIVYRVGNKRIKIRANSIDKSILTEVLLERKYFPKGFALRKDAVVVDLGAHIGIFSVLTNRKTFAVEPSKENFELLLEQIKLNNADVIPFKLAIADKRGSLKLYRGMHSARFSLVRKENTGYEIVKALPLKDFFEKNKIKRCDLLKIDVEGAEFKILYATPKETFNKIDNILMEWHRVDGADIEKLTKFLNNLGYNVRFGFDGGFLYATKRLA